jgi:hypothetical protein
MKIGINLVNVIIIKFYHRFLPTMARQALDSALLSAQVTPVPQDDPKGLECIVDDKTVTIGNTTAKRFVTPTKSKVPDVLFYDVPQVCLHLV